MDIKKNKDRDCFCNDAADHGCCNPQKICNTGTGLLLRPMMQPCRRPEKPEMKLLVREYARLFMAAGGRISNVLWRNFLKPVLQELKKHASPDFLVNILLLFHLLKR